MSLRTPQMEAQYQADKAAGRNEPLGQVKARREWSYWKLIHNRYPHDKLYLHHDMLVPKRQFASLKEASPKELKEFWYLISVELIDDYDCITLNFPSQQSIKTHFHAHLAVLKDNL